MRAKTCRSTSEDSPVTPSQAINGALRKVPAWTVYIVCAIWTAWMFYLGLTGGLGVEPINALEREYGELALQLLVLGLLVTPLRKWTGVNLLKFRRAIGVSAFFLVLAHFSVWAVLDVQSVERIWADIVKRPYVTVGMVGFVLMIPLALTSNNLSIRKLGAASWRKLHKLTYPIAILGAVHYLWLARGFQWEPLIYLAIIMLLLAARMKWERARAMA
ncbi:protein-methionine-sulfoxide reductase heme-binding subunit MsrQ [Cognatiyoonia sp. IB215182]|uniref:protein-methionine-sulfoxide reductase heme-binding subunit MsrQ n=1 Tax=Cognatiyoonia sp. IB215182 TaxID=3097353 RepID=UPI002A0F3FA0|nr:protein-methionine-sulfoxide reductase heme-binding subunit MsrQ [Cognatiyoonia sp. IB215182]MDX8352623.1 protein-methionine-sulfoxide reductase heme-binding subunit MsrQ [Cognatiyoonia sp. IB215182]